MRSGAGSTCTRLGPRSSDRRTPQTSTTHDYFVLGEVEQVSNKHAHYSSEALKQTIQDTVEKMDRAVVKGACGMFRSWLERVGAAEGGHIE